MARKGASRRSLRALANARSSPAKRDSNGTESSGWSIADYIRRRCGFVDLDFKVSERAVEVSIIKI